MEAMMKGIQLWFSLGYPSEMEEFWKLNPVSTEEWE